MCHLLLCKLPSYTRQDRKDCKKNNLKSGNWKKNLDIFFELLLLLFIYYRCPRYTNLPARCRLVADYLNPCCKKPYCEFKGTTGEITGTMTPAPGLQTTLVPLPNGQTRPTPQPTPKMPGGILTLLIEAQN